MIACLGYDNSTNQFPPLYHWIDFYEADKRLEKRILDVLKGDVDKDEFLNSMDVYIATSAILSIKKRVNIKDQFSISRNMYP